MRKKLLVGVIFLCMVGLVLGGTQNRGVSKPWKAEDKGMLVRMTEQAMSTESAKKFLTKNVVEVLNRFEKNVDMSRFHVDKSQTRLSKKVEKTAYVQAIIITEQEWVGSAWVNTGRITTRINVDGNNLEIKFEYWDGTTFKNLGRAVGTFDANGLLVLVLTQLGDAAGTGWIDLSRTTYTYDANFFLVESLTEANTGWSWVPINKYVLTNNPNGDAILEVYYTWDGTAWANNRQWSYTWIGSNLTQEIGQFWEVSAWVNEYKDDYTYDGFGNENTDTYQLWNGWAWENYGRWEGVYYGFDTMHYETIQYWNGSSWDWYYQWIYTYNPSWYLTEELYQMWNGTAWDNYMHWLYSYDGSWNQTIELEQVWIGSIWYNSYRISGTYDAHNYLIDVVYQNWDGAAWANEYRDLYTIEQSSGVADEEGIVPESFTLSNYPNPFNPSTTIRFDLPQGSELTMAVYDVNGRLVDRVLEGVRYEAGVHAVQWNGMDEDGKPVPSGVYLVKMEAGNTVKVHRCTLVK